MRLQNIPRQPNCKGRATARANLEAIQAERRAQYYASPKAGLQHGPKDWDALIAAIGLGFANW